MQRLVVPPDAGSSPVSRLNIMIWVDRRVNSFFMGTEKATSGVVCPQVWKSDLWGGLSFWLLKREGSRYIIAFAENCRPRNSIPMMWIVRTVEWTADNSVQKPEINALSSRQQQNFLEFLRKCSGKDQNPEISWTQFFATEASVPKIVKEEIWQARICQVDMPCRDECIRKKASCTETIDKSRQTEHSFCHSQFLPGTK